MVAETTSAAVPLSLPVGYHFNPSDEELLEYYLRKKIRGESFLYNVIPDCDLYGDKAPWEMFPRAAGTGRDRFFVFTRLKRLSKKRVSRTASIGEWHGNTCGAPIFDGNNNVMGTKRQLVFKVKKGKQGSGSSSVGHWIMHEFSLGGVDSDWVLCEIENKEKKRLREGVLCEMVNKGSKRLRMDEEGGFLTAKEDAGVSSSSSPWSEMLSELTDDLPLSPSAGFSTEQMSIEGEVQALENAGLSCGNLCDTLALSTKEAEEETMSSLESSITDPMTSSCSSLIPVALASNFDAEVENSGANDLVDLPLDEFLVDDDPLGFLLDSATSAENSGANGSVDLPQDEFLVDDDPPAFLLDFAASVESSEANGFVDLSQVEFLVDDDQLALLRDFGTSIELGMAAGLW